IAAGLKENSDALIQTAAAETALDAPRLQTELDRTIFQLTSYADACEEGSWMEVRINTPTDSQPHDLRKMLHGLGPVVVFGASNFPFAYSTAGGDTACALAAGCSVVVKAHGAHAQTSERVATIINKAAESCGLPQGVFTHLHGASFDVGKALVQHKITKAVGFTGSLQGGRALFDLAAQRPVPIPVFAEMGSINPVFILPQKLKEESRKIAGMYAQSITQSAGQFCTSPGVMVAVKSAALEDLKKELAQQLLRTASVKMLHEGIVASFHKGRTKALQTKGVELLTPVDQWNEALSLPTLAQTTATHFLQNPLLHTEVFGPYCLLVICDDEAEMLQVAHSLEGQLTTSLMATEAEAAQNQQLIMALQAICGRLIFNGVPTGVQVSLAMQHGGPYPATTDSRFTAVGADGIKRFARPVCYQNWPQGLLPDTLKNENPLGIWRTVNNNLTKEAIA
ncbi:MAG: aldehyde dehydrogenase (NADP(+)), partial [Chitinophagaceae bacterium]